MKPFTIITIKYTTILSVLLLTNFWVFNYAAINIPEQIPYTPIRINGLTIFCILFITERFALKAVLREYPLIELKKLFIIGFLICAIAEMLLQIVRVLTFDSGRLRLFLEGFAATTTTFTAITFLIAFQLKTKRTKILLLLIFAFYVIFYLFLYALPYFQKITK